MNMPRQIPDSECVQSKCGCVTTGCWGECSMKRSPVIFTVPFTNEVPRAEQVLRRLLAYRVAGVGLYADDGELQDNTVQPCIDFKRDSVDTIETKLIERTRKAFSALDPELVRDILTNFNRESR